MAYPGTNITNTWVMGNGYGQVQISILPGTPLLRDPCPMVILYDLSQHDIASEKYFTAILSQEIQGVPEKK